MVAAMWLMCADRWQMTGENTKPVPSQTRRTGQMFSFGTRRMAREALTEIGDRAGMMSLRISAKLSRTVRQPRATASAGTTSPERRWWLSSTGSRAATTSTSFRPRSSATSMDAQLVTSAKGRSPRPTATIPEAVDPTRKRKIHQAKQREAATKALTRGRSRS